MAGRVPIHPLVCLFALHLLSLLDQQALPSGPEAKPVIKFEGKHALKVYKVHKDVRVTGGGQLGFSSLIMGTSGRYAVATTHVTRLPTACIMSYYVRVVDSKVFVTVILLISIS
jgi:hypothetical protein